MILILQLSDMNTERRGTASRMTLDPLVKAESLIVKLLQGPINHDLFLLTS